MRADDVAAGGQWAWQICSFRRHVMGCISNQETRVKNALGDVPGNLGLQRMLAT